MRKEFCGIIYETSHVNEHGVTMRYRGRHSKGREGCYSCYYGSGCGYLGSGRALLSAVSKYGRESFTFKVIARSKSYSELVSLERKLVSKEWADRDDT